MRKSRTVFIVVIVVAAMVLLIARRKMQLKKAPAYGQRPVPVHVAKAVRESLETTHDYLAIAESWRTARISSRMAAHVVDVPTDEGDLVHAGDLLIQLDDQDLHQESDAVEAQIEAARATIASLETNLDYWATEDGRDSGLAKQGVIPQAAADATRNHRAAAEAKLEAARQNMKALEHRREAITAKLGYTKLVSPFDGLIITRDVDPGDLATPGKPLMVVEDRSRLKLAFDAPQEDLRFLKEGLPVHVPTAGGNMDLKITHMYPSLDHARMVHVEVETPSDAGFQSGAFVPLSVVSARHEDVVTVPKNSLMETPDGQPAVFVVKDGHLEARPVTKIMESANRVAVKGVEPGEQVVTSTFLGWAALSSGLKVEVAQ